MGLRAASPASSRTSAICFLLLVTVIPLRCPFPEGDWAGLGSLLAPVKSACVLQGGETGFSLGTE